jgi:hypothetical protein
MLALSLSMYDDDVSQKRRTEFLVEGMEHFTREVAYTFPGLVEEDVSAFLCLIATAVDHKE